MFPKTTIIGLGCIGSSIGMAIQARGLAQEIIGYDISEDACRAAVQAGALHKTGTLDQVVPESDLVVVAAPPSAFPVLFQHMAPLLHQKTILTDVAGVKQQVVQWAQAYLPSMTRFVSGHPIAGSELPGIAGASPHLFEGTHWILTPTEQTDQDSLQTVSRFTERLGAKPFLMEAEMHDRHFALLSHLPNLLANVLLMLAAGLEHPEIGGGSWRDLTRVGGTHPDLWTEILMSNQEAMLPILSRLQTDLDQLFRWLAAGQEDRVHAYLQEAWKEKNE
jgi:prephenate dehydrogenase